MNVYDFDKTIYNGDSTLDYYLFCLKNDWSLLRFFPMQVLALFKYLFGIYDKTRFKENFYLFLSGINNADDNVKMFWEVNQCKIQQWYLLQKNTDDVIISASPEFLLKPICNTLEIKHLIASIVDKNTGQYIGQNCYGREKVCRFREVFQYTVINNFYSDSFSDSPLAEIAQQSFILSNDELLPWHNFKPSNMDKAKSLFVSKEFILFLCIGAVNISTGILFASLLSLAFNANIAFIVGYILSLTLSYFLNSKFAFRETLSAVKYIRFCISYIPNFIVQNLFLIVLFNFIGVDRFVSYALSAIIGIPITFLAIKFFAFSKTLKK